MSVNGPLKMTLRFNGVGERGHVRTHERHVGNAGVVGHVQVSFSLARRHIHEFYARKSDYKNQVQKSFKNFIYRFRFKKIKENYPKNSGMQKHTSGSQPHIGRNDVR
jgi:hypothetical protein